MSALNSDEYVLEQVDSWRYIVKVHAKHKVEGSVSVEMLRRWTAEAKRRGLV